MMDILGDEASSPIFGTDGKLLGTDENGLKGKPIVMDKADFVQGMSFKDASAKNKGEKGLKDATAKKDFRETYDGLSRRPDYDGYINKAEADAWWQKGTGEALFVDASKIKLTDITVQSFDKGVGSTITPNFIFKTKNWKRTDTGETYGKLDIKLLSSDGIVKIGYQHTANTAKLGLYLDYYDFEYQSGLSNLGRNIATQWGKPDGDGKNFIFHSYGTAKIPIK